MLEAQVSVDGDLVPIVVVEVLLALRSEGLDDRSGLEFGHGDSIEFGFVRRALYFGSAVLGEFARPRQFEDGQLGDTFHAGVMSDTHFIESHDAFAFLLLFILMVAAAFSYSYS